MIQGILAAIKLAPQILVGIWNFIGLMTQIAKWVKETHEKSERAAAVKEISGAIKEARETLDNSKLLDILARKKNES